MQDNILVPDYMDWNLCFEPKIMKVFPNCDLLLDELSPVVRELFKVKIGDGQVVRPRADHVKKRSYTVKRATHQQYATLCSKLCLAVPLWVVRLHDPNAFINQALASQPHMHQRLVELLGDIAVRAADKAGDLF